MRFGSVCSGIEAASVAWNSLGWKAAWLAEIEPFPSAVIAHHYPNVPNHGDMTQLPWLIATGLVEAPELFCGGTPCQAFSVAGLRKSLDDARGNLSLTFCEIANAIDERRTATGLAHSIIFWENVPGVLSTADNAFGCFLAGLAGEDNPLEPAGRKWTNAGYVLGPKRAVAWRVLDAQYFGVAQRRRRVFVVASARNDFDPAAVLFEWDGVRRDTAPSREAGQIADPCVTAGAYLGNAEGGSLDVPFMTASSQMRCVNNQTPLVRQPVVHAPEIARCIATREGSSQDYETTTMVAQPVAFHPTQDPISSTDGTTHAMGCGSSGGAATVAVAHSVRLANTSSNGWGVQEEVTHTLDCTAGPAVQTAMQVRRLTPVECERLQGFPDGYTAIPWRKKPASECPDGPRYKALGNSWAVPVVRWIGRRIQEALNANP